MERVTRCVIATIRKGLWFPFIVFIVHEIAAYSFGNLYDRYPWLDLPMHFFGGFSFAYLSLVFVSQLETHRLITFHSLIFEALIVISFTVTAATFWEYAEWISDHTIGTHSQKGLDDTLMDTVMGLIGCCVIVMGHCLLKWKNVLPEKPRQGVQT